MAESLNPLLKSSLIFLGSGAGGLARLWIGGAVQHWWGPSFPMGTVLVNVTGCFAMGLLVNLWSAADPAREELRAAVLIGLLGGYTTFSAFGRDSLELARSAEWMRLALYIGGSVAISLLAVWAGAWIAGKAIGGGT